MRAVCESGKGSGFDSLASFWRSRVSLEPGQRKTVLLPVSPAASPQGDWKPVTLLQMHTYEIEIDRPCRRRRCQSDVQEDAVPRPCLQLITQWKVASCKRVRGIIFCRSHINLAEGSCPILNSEQSPTDIGLFVSLCRQPLQHQLCIAHPSYTIAGTTKLSHSRTSSESNSEMCMIDLMCEPCQHRRMA